MDSRAAALVSACGAPDGALARVAAALASERGQGAPDPDPDRVALLLRERGEPHVRPRVFFASGRERIDDERLRLQLARVRRDGTRCGVGLARTEDGQEVLVGVAVDALADLEALPTRARTGEWMTLIAALHVPATAAKLVVLGPRGIPRTVPTSLDRASGLVRARFALDSPGAFLVQLVADLAAGPQPVLEARLFADVEPTTLEERRAPGEEAGSGMEDDAAFARMTAALRASESLPPLTRDARLDALARAHAEAMRAAGTVAHDLGEGDLARRFEAEGLAAKRIGENVARARSIALVHRALHASPSHRMNLLRQEYTHVGLGVAADDAGTVYACQVFAAGL